MLTPANKRTLLKYWWGEWPGKGCIEGCEEIWNACEGGQIESSSEIERFCGETGHRVLSGESFKLFNCEMQVDGLDTGEDSPSVFHVLVVAPSVESVVENGPIMMQERYRLAGDEVKVSFHSIQAGVGEAANPFDSFVELVIPAL